MAYFAFDELDALEEEKTRGVVEATVPPADEQLEQPHDWILVYPCNGLCNKLSAVVSGILLAKDASRALAVDWRPSDACHCPWERLFEAPQGFHLLTSALVKTSECLQAALEIVEAMKAATLARNTGNYAEAVRTQGMLRCIIAAHRDNGLVELIDVHDRQWEGLLHLRAKCLLIPAYDQFYPAGINFEASQASRSAALQQIRLNASFGSPTAQLASVGALGVHVRRGDHQPSWRRSPEHAFFCAIDSILAGEAVGCIRGHFSSVFLSTDDPGVESRFKERYAGSLRLLQKRCLDRTKPECIEDALRDLVGLSQCNAMLGSFDSSFSKLAALFRQVPLHVIDIGEDAEQCLQPTLSKDGGHVTGNTWADPVC